VVDSRTGVILFALIWLGGAIALAGSAHAFGKWMLVAAAVWLIPVGWLVASLVVLLAL
jgi:hypothetical protein